jgi:hypothetical protein
MKVKGYMYPQMKKTCGHTVFSKKTVWIYKWKVNGTTTTTSFGQMDGNFG